MANYMTCFFHVIGSYDSPRNMSKDERFGFTEEDRENPIFGYTLNDVEKSFEIPRIIARNALHGTDIGTIEPDVSRIVTEANNNTFLENETDVTTDDWDNVFHVLEYVYAHQDIANDFVDVYGNKAEEALTVSSSEYYAPKYNPNTLYIEMSNLVPDRVKKISFTNTLNGTSFHITAYMTPDDLIEYYQDKVEIYEYIDADDVAGISKIELKTQILNKILTIQNENGFNRYDVINTLFTDDDGTQYMKYFYVFTLFNLEKEMNPIYLSNKVKDYLITKHNADYVYLKAHYVDLFRDIKVKLFPLLQNVAGNIETNKVLSSVISLDSVQHTLTERGYNYIPDTGDDVEYKSVEVFILYGTTDMMEENYIMVNPIIAVEDNDPAGLRPISHRYPNFIPKIPESRFDKKLNMFHHLVSLAQNILSGIVSVNVNDVIIDGVPTEYEFTLHWKDDNNDFEIDYISFTDSGVLYEMYPPPTLNSSL